MIEDDLWMKRALDLARRGLGRTSPNPMVGAVLVNEGKEVGSGWHAGPGQPHAEIIALSKAGAASRGATLYASLEPCVHHGRTPPCTEAVIEAGVGRVVATGEDPDPKVSGRGLEALVAAGLRVSTGVREKQARNLNAAYFVHRLLGRPFVTYKAALSLDGRMAAADRSSRWLTGPEARRDVHRLRAISDAICVGISTVLADDPALTVREVRKHKAPLRVVVDSSARTPADANVMSAEAPTLIATTEAAPKAKVVELRASGADVVVLPSESGKVSIPVLLELLAKRGVLHLMLEGGGILGGAFAAAGLVDRYVLYLAPKLLGGESTLGLLEGWSAPGMFDAQSLEIEAVRRVGADLKIVARPERKDE